MNKRMIVIWLAVLVCVLWLSNLSKAMESNSYALKWSVTGGGGGPIQSVSYAINATAGQANTGIATSADYQISSGYWYRTTTEYAIYLPVVLKNYNP